MKSWPRNDGFTALWSYPWDLLAEGLETSLGRIAAAGLKGISLAVSYHAGMLLLPHNPQQKVRFLEDGAVYFRPRPERFAGLAIQPRVSALADGVDPLEAICAAAQRHGLQVVAWTVCCHNSHQGERHPDLALHNAFGDPYPFALCPCQPAVQDYLQALLQDLGRYPLRALQLESFGYMGFYHGYHHEKILLNVGPLSAFMLGLCFCPACRRQAEAEGIEAGALQEAVQRYLLAAFEGEVAEPERFSREALLEAVPGLEGYLRMRDDVVTRLVQRLARASAVPLSLLATGPNMAELQAYIAEATACAYRAQPEEVIRNVRAARAAVGPDVRLAIGLEATPHLSPSAENLAAKVRAAWEAGAEGLYFYNYGLMPLRSLGWLAQALGQ